MPISANLSEQVLSLPTADREELIELLDRSLDVEQLQADLNTAIERRAAELESGVATPVAGEEAFLLAERAVRGKSFRQP